MNFCYFIRQNSFLSVICSHLLSLQGSYWSCKLSIYSYYLLFVPTTAPKHMGYNQINWCTAGIFHNAILPIFFTLSSFPMTLHAFGYKNGHFLLIITAVDVFLYVLIPQFLLNKLISIIFNIIKWVSLHVHYLSNVCILTFSWLRLYSNILY